MAQPDSRRRAHPRRISATSRPLAANGYIRRLWLGSQMEKVDLCVSIDEDSICHKPESNRIYIHIRFDIA